MTRLEDLTPNAAIRGIIPDQTVTVVNAQWFGSEALELTYKDASGKVANELLYRYDEPRIELVEFGRPWSFDGDGALFRLVSEANRIRLAHLFDPVLAVHTSLVDPLPHQITAVYEAMLPRQPLRFLLADDPGAGKTIMAGLLIKELIVRGDLQRCLIVCPGSLAEQWQDELNRRFQLPFEIMTNDKLEAARTGNWFAENNLVIARLDKLSRDEDVQAKLQAPDCQWDLVVCDEAHKLSATFFGGEAKFTKRYRLGQLLSGLTCHFLLMTATPHNGKEEDFQLFLALLDGDRFEGRFRDGVHQVDVSDLMRRMVKENLLKFDGKPLFPERVAETVPYKLSDAEAHLYKEVTDYVRNEFDRAEALANEKQAGTVGFALTILQRRLASSPEAIYQSLRRRSDRLQRRLREFEILQRGGMQNSAELAGPTLDPDDVEDLEDAPDAEVEVAEEEFLDQATAARTIEELKAEIATLSRLEARAAEVRRSGEDRKWRELAGLLHQVFSPASAAEPNSIEPNGGGKDAYRVKSSPTQKLVIFTEHRDTLTYLQDKVGRLLGRANAVVVIHGGMGREDQLNAQEAFKFDPETQVLIATDAAGEGINLQRAHLMVNYDLPWNPNRLEQRFGRIHRIGQTEVCHLWNLVASETREGDVYHTLLEKLEQARKSLGGQVATTFLLGTKPGKEAYIQPLIEGDSYRFTVEVGKSPSPEAAKIGTKSGSSGSSFLCLMSGAPMPFDYLRAEAKAGRMGTRLMATVAEGDRGRIYFSPTPAMEAIAFSMRPVDAPDTELPKKALSFRVQEYGMTRWCDLFTQRQLVALTTFSDLVQEAYRVASQDYAAAYGDTTDAGNYAQSIAAYLGLTVGRITDYSSTICTWANNPQMEIVRGTFARQALPMTWDFAESNPFGPSTGSLEILLGWVCKVIDHLPAYGKGEVYQHNATQPFNISTATVVSADPPYYDNIGYADLSDFFYVWLRRALKGLLPGIFSTLGVPKAEELVATPFRHESRKAAEAFFLSGMTQAMHQLAIESHPAFPVTIYYAFKQSEVENDLKVASTGWETFLGALINAGFGISGTWPIRTERSGRSIGIGTNALASSIVLVCRKRFEGAPTATRREFVQALEAELAPALRNLQEGNIAPVDLAQAAIGPGMAVYIDVHNKASLVLDVSLLHSLAPVKAASRSSNSIPKLPRMPLKA